MEEEEEEEEEENADIHFKRKQKSKSCKKRAMKKPHRHTSAIAESKSFVIISPPALPFIKLSTEESI